MNSTHAAQSVLRAAGIQNPRRLVNLIERTITTLHLDLRGFTVLTEAASGPYVVTPIIAALANADRVFALTRDSHYASASQVIEQTNALANLCDVYGLIQIAAERRMDYFSEADIVTNLGFVRPIDANAVAFMRPGTVVSLMCESWEFRPGDIDVEACRSQNIMVLGVNEDFPGLDIFSYSGWLCQKLLFDAQIEQHKSKIVVASGDKFGLVISKHLVNCGCNVRLVPKLNDKVHLSDSDALVVADYTREDVILGRGGDLTPEMLKEIASGITIVQFAGLVDVDELRSVGLTVYPGIPIAPHRMAVTLAGLGPRPVVELHAAGLKVGELAAKQARDQSISDDPYIHLVQHIA